MSEAPETIWAFYTPDDFDDTATITAYEMMQYGGKEYRRADLPTTLSAAMELPEVRALVDALVAADKYIDKGHFQMARNITRAAITAIAPFTEAKP